MLIEYISHQNRCLPLTCGESVMNVSPLTLNKVPQLMLPRYIPSSRFRLHGPFHAKFMPRVVIKCFCLC